MGALMGGRFLGLLAIAVVAASGNASADDLAQIKDQIDAAKQKNAELLSKLEKIEKGEAGPLRAGSVVRQPAPDAFVGQAVKAPLEALTSDGPLRFHGITIFGVLDAGVAWQSHGAPLNGYYPQGLEYAIQKNSNHSMFSVAPGGMGYSGIGLKGEEEILPGFAGVFGLNTQFNLASGQLGNGPASLVQNNGVPLAYQSSNGDSARSGQAFNDYAYLGVSSTEYGVLTYGRQKTLTTDDRSVYDPIAGSLAFSLLGYSGSLSSGDTENSRFDNSLKYLVHVGPARFGAIYKLGQPGTGASQTNGATYQVSAGFDVQALSFDAVYSHVSGAITLSSLSVAQAATLPAGSLAATISDNSAVLLSAKYSYGPFKFFGGYEHINYADPNNPIVAPYVDSNGYAISVATNNAFQYHDKILQLWWTGVKYAFDSHLDLSVGYYHEWQNSYGKIACNFANNTKLVANASTCSGAEDAIGFVGEYHFSKKLEAYAGLMYTTVSGGMANGFLYTNTVDPTIGLRYTF
jgi:predicted porin